MTATSTLARGLRAWDFDSETPVDWRQQAACRGMWDLFTGYLPTQYDEQAKASHICYAHCAAFGECELFSLLHRNDGIVLAGASWVNGRRVELPDPGCGDWCRSVREVRRAVPVR